MATNSSKRNASENKELSTSQDEKPDADSHTVFSDGQCQDNVQNHSEQTHQGKKGTSEDSQNEGHLRKTLQDKHNLTSKSHKRSSHHFHPYKLVSVGSNSSHAQMLKDNAEGFDKRRPKLNLSRCPDRSTTLSRGPENTTDPPTRQESAPNLQLVAENCLLQVTEDDNTQLVKRNIHLLRNDKTAMASLGHSMKSTSSQLPGNRVDLNDETYEQCNHFQRRSLNEIKNYSSAINLPEPVSVNTKQVLSHQQPASSVQWPELDNVGTIRPFRMKDCLRNREHDSSMDLLHNEGQEQEEDPTQRLETLPMGERMDLDLENDQVFGKIKTNLDELLLDKSTADGIMSFGDKAPQKQESLANPTESCEKTVTLDESSAHTKDITNQAPSGINRDVSDVELMSLSQLIAMDHVNSVLALLEQLPVGHRIAYFNNRIQTSLSEVTNSKGRETVRQLLAVFSFCLLRHQQIESDYQGTVRSYLYTLDVVKTLVNCVCGKYEALQISSIACWLLAFLIMEPFAAHDDQKDKEGDTPQALEMRQDFSRQFLASQGAKFIADRLQEDAVPDLTFMNISINLSLPLVALATTPFGRTWLEQNCRDHISEYKRLLIHKKSVLDMIPVVFPLMTQEIVERIVDEFVSFAENVEAKDRERNLAELLEEEEQDRIKREQRKKKKRQKKQGRSKKGNYLNPGADVSSEDEQLPVIPKIHAAAMPESVNTPTTFNINQERRNLEPTATHNRTRDSVSVSELPQVLSRNVISGLKDQRILGHIHNQDHFPDDFPPITRATLNKTPDTTDKGWVNAEGRCLANKRENVTKEQSTSTDTSKPLRWADVARIGCSNTDRKSHLTVLSNDSEVYPKVSVHGKGNDVSSVMGSETYFRPNRGESTVGESRIHCGCGVTPSCASRGNEVDLTQSSDNESDDETQSSSSECPHFLFSPSFYPRRMGSRFNADKSLVMLKESCPGVVPARKAATDSSLGAWPTLNRLKKIEGGSESMPCLWEDTKIDDRVFSHSSQGTRMTQKEINQKDVDKVEKEIIRLPQVGNPLHRTRSMDVMDIDNCSKRKYQRPLTQPDRESSSAMSDQNLKGSIISDFINVSHDNPAVARFHGIPRIEPFTNLPPVKGKAWSSDKTRSVIESWKLKKLCSEDANGESKSSHEINEKESFGSKPYSTSCSNVFKRPGYKSFTFFPSACNIPQATCDQTTPPTAVSSALASPLWSSNQPQCQQNDTGITSSLEKDMSPPKAANNVQTEEKNLLNSLDKYEPSKIKKSTTSLEVPVSFQVFEDNLQIWQSPQNVSSMCTPSCEKTIEELTLQRLKEIWQKDYVATLAYPFTSISVAPKTKTETSPGTNEAGSQSSMTDQGALPCEQNVGICQLAGKSEFCHQQTLRADQADFSLQQAPSDFHASEKRLLKSCLDYTPLSRQAGSVEFEKPSLTRGLTQEWLLSDDQYQQKQKNKTKPFGPWQPLGNPSRQPLLQSPAEAYYTKSVSASLEQKQQCFQQPNVDYQPNPSPPVLFPEDLHRPLTSPIVSQGLFPAFHDSRAGDFLNELFTDSLFVDKIAVNQLRQKIRSSWTTIIPSSDTPMGVLRDSAFIDDLDYYASIYSVKIKDILKGQNADTTRQAYTEETGLVPNEVPSTITYGTNGKIITSKRWYEGLVNILELPWTKRHQIGDVILPPCGLEYKICTCSQGSMYLGYTTDGRESAVLVVDKSQFHIDAYRLEVLRNPELEHHFLLRCQGSGENSQSKYLAFQLCEYTLIEFLQLMSVSPNQEESAVNGLAWQLLEGLNFIHVYLGIPHGNLKPSWIFVDAEGRLRLGGFGIEVVKYGDEIKGQNNGTSGCDPFGWQPCDDVVKDRSGPSLASDVQMAGILIYYILTKGLHPFNASTLEAGLTRENLVADNHLGEETFDMLSGMMFLDPELRPSADQCLKHPFFWSAERKFRLILLVGSDVLTEMKTGVALTGCGAPTMMEILGLVDINEVSPNWVQEVNMIVMKEMRSFRVYKNNLSELALFIYNCCLHFDKLSNVAKDVLDEPCKYFLTLFPSLFMSIYRSLKSSDRVQRTCYRPFFS